MNTTESDTKIRDLFDRQFWDSLHTGILNSSNEFSKEDILSYVEKSFMFSLFCRGASHKELSVFKSILNFKNLGFVILFEFLPKEETEIIDFDIDELSMYYFIKNELKGISAVIGPMIHNRFCLLVTDDAYTQVSANDLISNSIAIAENLLKSIENKIQTKLAAGIGNVHSIHSIYTSYFEALSCIQYCNPGEIIHVNELVKHDKYYNFEYKEAEKNMIEAVRLRKPESYNYFLIMMNRISQLNDAAKRNKIIEALVLSSHASRIGSMNEMDYFDYTSHISSLMSLRGQQLIEWAFQQFLDITGQVKKRNTIDYSNKIVQATKEYLEAHYTEEISLEDVAEYVNISPQYFSKLIKKHTGFNFIDWLSMLRVNKAKELLTNSNLTVKEVCYMVGYKDPNYFSRIFKKKIGLTPSEYIKKNTFS
jgi:two-component system response regulator YesN